MDALREYITVKDQKVSIDLPKEFDHKEVEVIVLPRENEDLSHLQKKVQEGMKSPLAKENHEDIFENLEKRYADLSHTDS